MTAPLTEAEIEELEKAERAATPGPWAIDNYNKLTIYYGDEWKDGFYIVPPDDMRDGAPDGPKAENTALIAAARNTLPRLLADWRRMHAALRQIAEDGCDAVYGHHNCDERCKAIAREAMERKP